MTNNQSDDDNITAKYVFVNHTYASPGSYNIAIFATLQVLLFIINSALSLSMTMYMLWFPTIVIFVVISAELIAKSQR